MIDRFRLPVRGVAALAGAGRDLDATKALEDASRLVYNAAYGGRLGALIVQLRLHQGNKLLPRLMRAVLVDNVVEVEQVGVQILDFLGPLDEEV